MKRKYPNVSIKALEPGQEPEQWERLGITAVPTILVSVKGSRPVMLRGYSDDSKIQNAIRGVTHEGK